MLGRRVPTEWLADSELFVGRNLGAKLGVDGLVLRRTGVEGQQNQRDFGRGGGDRTHETLSGLTAFNTVGLNRSSTPPVLGF